MGQWSCLTVGLLEACTCGTTTELLRLTPTRIGHKKGTIEGQQYVLDFLLGCFIHVFLVVSDESLCNSLTDCVDLGCVSSSLHPEADVHILEAWASQQEERLKHLVSKDLRLDQLEWASIDLDQTTATLAVRHSHSCFLSSEGLHTFHRE